VSEATEQESPGQETSRPADSPAPEKARDSPAPDKTPPKVNALDPEAEGVAGENAEGEGGQSESRGHEGQVVTPTVLAKNIFTDSYIRIEGDFIVGDDVRLSMPVADVTRSVTVARETFVEPGSFQALKDALANPSVVLLVGAACGKRTAAGVALQLTGHEPILQLPSDMAVRNLVDGVTSICKKSPAAGIVIESVDSRTLATLAGFEMHRLEEVLAGGAALILTTQSADGIPQDMDGVVRLDCSAPSLERVIERSTAAPEAQKTVLAALALLDDHVLSPADALTLLGRACESDKSPGQLAQEFDGSATDGALDQWLSKERTADHVASLAAGAALEGAPIVDVDLAAQSLSETFASDFDEPTEGVKTFRVADRGWPKDMIAVAQSTIGTHFGQQMIEVATVCPPHTRERIIDYLWRRLGHDFRAPFVEWLRDLASDQDAQVRLGAGVTAGVLFVTDPVIAERELIKPWALDKRFSRRLCAAIALGAPVALGADPAGARALTKRWSDSPDLSLRHVAVLAYGGLLGAWDPESAAPTHLWRIAIETAELARAANISLASLTAAGGSAARVRATVIGLLSAQMELERVPRRVYELLPIVLRQLTAPGEVPRDSLTALLADEQESFQAFATLIATAFSAPRGFESARAALEVLLRALADGRLERRTAFKVIAQVRQAAREEGELDVLDAQLERVLWANARQKLPIADAARFVLNEFFPSS
jgi:hypothetical protein